MEPFTKILELSGKPSDCTGMIVLRVNRGTIDSPPELPRATKKEITTILRKLLPFPFEAASRPVERKYGLEWFRVKLHFVKGAMVEGWYELPTGSGGWSVARFSNKGYRNRNMRPNEKAYM